MVFFACISMYTIQRILQFQLSPSLIGFIWSGKGHYSSLIKEVGPRDGKERVGVPQEHFLGTHVIRCTSCETVHMYICIHTHTLAGIHVCIYRCIYIYICTYAYTRVCICTCCCYGSLSWRRWFDTQVPTWRNQEHTFRVGVPV